MSVTAVASVTEQCAETAEQSELELGLISNARRRQRRRYVASLILVALMALGGVFIASILSGTDGSPATGARSGRSAITHEPAARAFAQAPYMGIACRLPHWIACDRIGLAVWLSRPATVTAIIAGQRFALDNPTWSNVARPGHLYMYAGFLKSAGLSHRLGVVPSSKWNNSWLGANPPSPLVRFQIDYRTGQLVSTEQHVYLSAGWG